MARIPRFARYYPRDQPPPVRGTILNGKRTPRYGLAWVVSKLEYMRPYPNRDPIDIRDLVTAHTERRRTV